jgi:hypothetical protein
MTEAGRKDTPEQAEFRRYCREWLAGNRRIHCVKSSSRTSFAWRTQRRIKRNSLTRRAIPVSILT